MNTIQSTTEFDKWLASLRDKVGKARILQRLDSAALGNFGDCEPVGSGVSECGCITAPAIACTSPAALSVKDQVSFIYRGGRNGHDR